MAVEVHRLELVAASRGMDRLIVDLRVTENQAGRTERATNSLMNSIMGLVSVGSAGFALVGLIKTADDMKLLQARLDVATGSLERNTEAMKTSLRIAQEATAPLETIASTYSGVARAGRDLQLGQQGVVDVTNTIAKAMVVSGTSVAEAKGALTQFNQAMASGVLRGEEFNSVNEQLPRLMQAIADGFENADGSIGVLKGELRAMAAEGQLTMDKVIPAIRRGMKAIEDEAARIPVTVGGAWQRVLNAAKVYIAESDNASGTTAKLAEKISGLANEFDRILNTAEALAYVIGGRLVIALGASTAATVKDIIAKNAAIGANIALLRSDEQLAIAAARQAVSQKELSIIILQRAEAENVAAIAAARAAAGTSAETAANARLIATTEALNAARIQSVASSTAATAATAAQTAATGALTTATAAATVGSRVLAASLAFLASPLGMVVTLVGTAAAAWVYFGDTANENADKVAQARERLKSTKSTSADIEALQEQEKLLNDEIKIIKDGLANNEYFYKKRAEAKLAFLEKQKTANQKEQSEAVKNYEFNKTLDESMQDLDSGKIGLLIQQKNYREFLATANDFLTQKEKIDKQILEVGQKFDLAVKGLSETDSRYIDAVNTKNKIISQLNAKKAEIDQKAIDEQNRAEQQRKSVIDNIIESLYTEEEAIKKGYARQKAIIETNIKDIGQRESLIAKLDAKLIEDLNNTKSANAARDWADAIFDELVTKPEQLIKDMQSTPLTADIKLYEERIVGIKAKGGDEGQTKKATDALLSSVDANLGLSRTDDEFEQQKNKELERQALELAMLKELYDGKEALTAEYQLREAELKKKHAKNLDDIDQKRKIMVLTSAGDIAASLSDIAKNTVGEQSRTYKNLFAITKGFSIAIATLKMGDALADAMAEGATLTEKLASYAIVASSMGQIISGIQSVKMLDTGGFIPAGQSGIVGEKGAEIVNGPAYVESRRNSAEKLNNMKGGGGVVVNITNLNQGVEVEKTGERTNENGQQVLDFVIKKVVADIQQGGTQLSRSIESAYNLRRGA